MPQSPSVNRPFDATDETGAVPCRFPGLVSAAKPCEVILLSPQDPLFHDKLVAALAKDAVITHCCDTAKGVQQILKQHACVALMIDVSHDGDVAIPEEDVTRLLAQHPYLRLIAFVPPAVKLADYLQELLRLGWLYDFHTMPVDPQRLAYCLGHLHGLVQLERRYAVFQKAAKAGYGHIIGTSPCMQKIYESIWRISKVDTPVLLTGESGTGKELIAHTLHDRSKFRDGKFVAVNCAALPPNLIGSELFGHEAGAFTGANKLKRGLVEGAHNGTLFLDEIGDLPLELQPHFLRFLQDGSFKRVGGTSELRIQMRVIAATNSDLKSAMQRGRFRDDLYYRLNVLALEVPPLRERENDIELLGDYYLQKFCLVYNRPRMRFSNKAIMAMVRYVWPGNVRELVSAISRAVVMTRGTLIQPDDLGIGITLPLGAHDDQEAQGGTEVSLCDDPDRTLFEARDAFDRQFIAGSLKRNRNNIQRTARALAISRVALYRLMKRYNIVKQDIVKRDGGGL